MGPTSFNVGDPAADPVETIVEIELQWGRRLSTSETLLIHSYTFDECDASMGPTSFNVGDCCGWCS